MKSSLQCTACRHRLSADNTERSAQWLKYLYSHSPFSLRLMLVNMLLRQLKATNREIPPSVCPESPFRNLQKINITVI